MKRREFITLIGSTATWPLAVRAQQATIAGDWISRQRFPGTLYRSVEVSFRHLLAKIRQYVLERKFFAALHESAFGTKRGWQARQSMSDIGVRADIALA